MPVQITPFSVKFTFFTFPKHQKISKMNEQAKIVVLDGYTLNPGDLSWNELNALGKTSIYDRTSMDEVVPRAKDADVLVVNKVAINRAHIEQLPKLRCICVSATGYNNIDLAATRERGISVSNAVGYGTHSVAQHVFALLLEFSNQVALHRQSVLDGGFERISAIFDSPDAPSPHSR